jgi:hypothetical protein
VLVALATVQQFTPNPSNRSNMNLTTIMTTAGLALLFTFSNAALADSSTPGNNDKSTTAPPVLAVKPATCQASSETSKAKDGTVQKADCTFLYMTCFENPDGSHCCYAHYTCGDHKVGSCGQYTSSLGVDGKNPKSEQPAATGGFAAF